MMSTTKSKLAFWKLGSTLILFAALTVVLFQNTSPVRVDLLLWEANISLSFLLLGVSMISAIIVFVLVLISGK